MEKHEEANMNSFQFSEEMDIQSLISPPEAGNSFTALLELPSNEAVMLLHSPAIEIMNLVKQEFVDSDLTRNSSLNLSSGRVISNSTKRKEREKNVKMSMKKSKSVANEDETDGEKLPYVHLRAQRGQATDSHSLAERARREKINAKMKLLQELVPGCNKISGTAMVLDEIINHVQSLQHQVEFLSRRLAALHPNVNNNLDSIYSAESGSLMDGNFTGMVSPRLSHQIWQPDELTHQRLWGVEDMNPNFINEENSLLCFDSSDTLHTDQLKMEV